MSALAQGEAPAVEAAVEAGVPLVGPRAPPRLLRPPGSHRHAEHLSAVIARLIGRCLDDADADADAHTLAHAPALSLLLRAKL